MSTFAIMNIINYKPNLTKFSKIISVFVGIWYYEISNGSEHYSLYVTREQNKQTVGTSQTYAYNWWNQEERVLKGQATYRSPLGGWFYYSETEPVSSEIFAPVRKSPLAKGGDYFMHAEHEQFAPRRFIHDRRLSENRPSIVWPWENRSYDGDLLNGGDFFT